jgi:hypothetical protein
MRKNNSLKLAAALIVCSLVFTIAGCAIKASTPAISEIAGVILSGGDTTPESGPLDTPRKYVYEVRTDGGSAVRLSYTAYPPSPVGDAARAKIVLDFYYGTIRQGDYVKARGSYDQSTNTVTVAQQGDYIKTYAQKP